MRKTTRGRYTPGVTGKAIAGVLLLGLGGAAGYALRAPSMDAPVISRVSSASPAAPASTPEIEPIFDRDYLPAALETISRARRSIFCVMFSAGFDESKHGTPERLLEALAAAHKRGVRVEVILDANRKFWERDRGARDEIETKNDPAAAWLTAHGVEVFRDGLDQTTHSKVLVADEETVILGSTNWTYSALARNHEASVRVRSRDFARQVLDRLEKIEKSRYLNKAE